MPLPVGTQRQPAVSRGVASAAAVGSYGTGGASDGTCGLELWVCEATRRTPLASGTYGADRSQATPTQLLSSLARPRDLASVLEA